MPSLVAGDVIGGKYVLDRLLGRGGMGAVFAARQTNLNHRQVAIKVMLADSGNEEARQRFLNEGGAAATLRSEHVVQVYDLGSERGFEYMVLELLEGEDLSQLLERSGPMPPATAVGYVLQALRGLVEAHRHGIVHRDLKPSNLFLARRNDGTSVLKILDFGISKAQSLQNPLGQAPGALTSTKAMLGSPLYMSPEQLRSSKNVDARADLWAMGVILYELMTGRLPYMGESLGELFASILENEPVPPRTYAPAIPPALEQVILRCLQKRVDQRFTSASELYDALNQIAAQGATAPAPSAMAATALPPNGSSSSPGFGSSPGLPVAASGSSPGMPGMAVTPGYGRPPGQQTTGSAANMPVVKGTVPLGASTPGLGESSPAWTPPAQKGAGVLVAVGGAVAAIVVIAGVAFVGMRSRTAGAGGAASASASAALVATAPQTPSATPSASASAAPTVATPEPAAPSASAASTAAAAQVATAGNGGAKAKPPVSGTKPTTTTKPAETAVAAQTPPPSAPVVPVTATPATTPRPKDGPGVGVNTR